MDTAIIKNVASNLVQLSKELLTASASLESLIGEVPAGNPSTQPATEVPRIFDAMKTMVDAAVHAGKLDLTKYGIGVFSPGYIPGVTQLSVRMTQEQQDALDAEIRAVAQSDWGKEWLSHNENAATIDRGYSFEFAGYWVSRQPDNNLVIHTTAP